MSRFRAWGLAAVAAVGATTPAFAADPPPRQTTLVNKLFGPAKPKPPGPTTRSGTGTSLGSPMTATLPSEVMAASLQAEQDALNRRMEVCLKLQQIGLETNNDALIRQAAELERQATALYTARTAALGVPRVKAALPEAADAVLDRQLGTGIAVNPLTAPPAPTPATGSASLKSPLAPTPASNIREVRP